MGLFSIFESKKPIQEIVADYARVYNTAVNDDEKDSVTAFKELAKYTFSEAIRTRTTIHTNPESSFGWFFHDINKMTGRHNDDRDLIKSYLYNAISNAHKHFWEPVSDQKMKLLGSLIEKSVVSKFSNASPQLKEELVKISEVFNNAMIRKKKNAVESLKEALDFADDQGYSDASKKDLIDAMKVYSEKIMTIVNYNPSNSALRNLIVDCISDFAFKYFFSKLNDKELMQEDITKIVDKVLFR